MRSEALLLGRHDAPSFKEDDAVVRAVPNQAAYGRASARPHRLAKLLERQWRLIDSYELDKEGEIGSTRSPGRSRMVAHWRRYHHLGAHDLNAWQPTAN